MYILALDFGTKNIGLAWVDTGIGVVLPFGVSNAKELPGLINKEKIEQVVVGLPIGLNGKENANTERVRKFAKDLENKITAPVAFFDERFSSAAADQMGEGVSRDEKSAMIILEDYLARMRKGS